MYKFSFALVAVLFLACNNSTPPVPPAANAATPTAAAGNWSKEDQMEFMDECVSGARGSIGEEKAYTKCKCIFTQVQAKYASFDSTVVEKLKDTAEVMAMARNCE